MIIGQVTPPLAMRAELDLEDASTSGAAEYLSVKGPNVAHRWLVGYSMLTSSSPPRFVMMACQVESSRRWLLRWLSCMLPTRRHPIQRCCSLSSIEDLRTPEKWSAFCPVPLAEKSLLHIIFPSLFCLLYSAPLASCEHIRPLWILQILRTSRERTTFSATERTRNAPQFASASLFAVMAPGNLLHLARRTSHRMLPVCAGR